MGEELATWEWIVVGISAVGLSYFIWSTFKLVNEVVRNNERNWTGLLLRLCAVALLMMVINRIFP